jgi:MoxR-like ATPase
MATEPVVNASLQDAAAIAQLTDAYAQLTAQLGRVIIGQRAVVDELVTAMLAGGHALLVGVPGLAKTLMVRTLADTLDLSFNRVQFTPDLMPADITGTEVIQEDKATGTRVFRFLPGPIFANVVLADEINRTPPKTQAALLEAMQERQVTIGGQQHRLPDPFFVLATQNPIEQEGTYPLPEAQLDRFMFEIRVDYPTEDEEFEIVRQTTLGVMATVERVLSREAWQHLQQLVRKVPVSDSVVRYALQFARLTRKHAPNAPDFLKKYVSWGAGPRASQFLILGAKARALLQGRPYVSPEDVRAVALPTLRHRLVLNFNAEADGLTADDLIRRLIEVIPEHPTTSSIMPAVWKS